MRTVAKQPTAVWMDRISAITGNADGNGLKFHLDNAAGPEGLRRRSCSTWSSTTCPAATASPSRPTVSSPPPTPVWRGTRPSTSTPSRRCCRDPKYANIRIVGDDRARLAAEPDRRTSARPPAQQAAPYYKAGVKYALDKLHAIPNVYNYIDIGHSGWLGWDSNAGPSATLFADVAKSTTAGFASIDGFVSDVANTTPLVEPFLPDSTISVGGTPIRSSSFYEWNFDFDEVDFTAHMYTLLVAAGLPVVDRHAHRHLAQRLGRPGPSDRRRRPAPTTTPTSTSPGRQARPPWRVVQPARCRHRRAAAGHARRATPASHLDAFVWIKPPGESDGASTDIANDQGKRFDRMCDPTFVSPKLTNQLTGATPDAPLAGQWFEDQFKTLVANAYPVIAGGTRPDRHDGALGADGSDGRHHHDDVGPAVLDRVHRQRGRHRLRRLPRHHPGGHLHHDELHRDRPDRRAPRTRSRSGPRTPPATCRPRPRRRLGHHPDRHGRPTRRRPRCRRV